MLSYCAFVSHPVRVLDTRAAYGANDDLDEEAVECARAYILLAILVHYGEYPDNYIVIATTYNCEGSKLLYLEEIHLISYFQNVDLQIISFCNTQMITTKHRKITSRKKKL